MLFYEVLSQLNRYRISKLIEFIEIKIYIINSLISLSATCNTIIQQHEFRLYSSYNIKIDLLLITILAIERSYFVMIHMTLLWTSFTMLLQMFTTILAYITMSKLSNYQSWSVNLIRVFSMMIHCIS